MGSSPIISSSAAPLYACGGAFFYPLRERLFVLCWGQSKGREGKPLAIKTFVSVRYETDELGGIHPLQLVFRRRPYQIDRVLEARQAVAQNVGGNGLRFTVRIGQRKTYLFLSDQDQWFVEEKVPHEIARVGGLVQGENYAF